MSDNPPRLYRQKTHADIAPPPVVDKEEDRADYARTEDAAPAPQARLVRRSRHDRQTGALDVPARYKKVGQDYQWFVIAIWNEPTDSADLADARNQHWMPVHPREMPDILGPGYNKDTIDIRGQRLFTRPMYLSQEAKAEDYQWAEAQRLARSENALKGRSSQGDGLADVRGIRVVEQRLEVEHELGTYNDGHGR